MAKILILGAGVMGTAFSGLAAECGNEVRLVGTHLDTNHILSMRAEGMHLKLNMKISERIRSFTHDQLGEALSEGADLIVLGVNSAGVNWAIDQLGAILQESTPVLMLTKGLTVSGGNLSILPDMVKKGLESYGLRDVAVGAVAGPCIAAELAARRPTSVVIAFADTRFLNFVIPMLDASYYHVLPSTDVVGVEVCAAFKNYYALAVSCPAGELERSGYIIEGVAMHNAAAGLFSQSLWEMGYFSEYMGGRLDTVYGLAGAGDLYVTCQAGRNSTMGRLLGRGIRYSEAKAGRMKEDTIEGAELALAIGPTLDLLIQKKELDKDALPLAVAIFEAICSDRPLEAKWAAFYRRSNSHAISGY